MKTDAAILGQEAAAAILAVEKLRLSADNRARIDELRTQGFSIEQIRNALIADLYARKAA